MTKHLLLPLLILPLLFLAACDRLEEEDDHFGLVDRVELRDRATDALLGFYEQEQHAAGFQGPGVPHLHPGDEIAVNVTFIDTEGNHADLGTRFEYEVRAELVGPADVVEVSSLGNHVVVRGLADGETEVVFHLWHGGHPDFTTPPLAIEVVDH